MGQTLNCACLEHIQMESSHGDDASRERIDALKKGNKFMKSAYLGLTQQELFVRLSEDTSSLQWKTENTWTNPEHGEFDLTSQIKKFKLSGECGLQLIGLDDSIIVDLKAEDSTVRDKWMVTLSELLQSWADKPNSRPKSSVTEAGSSNKAEYLKNREAELLAREKANAERKAKYSAGGMKYTAMAMANRA